MKKIKKVTVNKITDMLKREVVSCNPHEHCPRCRVSDG